MSSASTTNFFNSYFNFLLKQGLPNAILHSYQNYPEVLTSDIDYCVKKEDLLRSVSLLSEFCAIHNWRLVQILQHEVQGYFCVCQSISNPQEYLQLDVCGDYTRESKFLVSSALLLKDIKQHPDKLFNIPAPTSEFIYLIKKGVAKNKPFEEVSAILDQIYLNNTTACDKIIREAGIEISESAIENLYREELANYKATKRTNRLANLKRQANRILHPGGLLVEIELPKPEAVDLELITSVFKPSFRKVRTSDSSNCGPTDLKLAIRSTLTLTTSQKSKNLFSWLLNKTQASLRIEATSTDDAIKKIAKHLESRTKKTWNLA